MINILLLVGKSASGKDTIQKELIKMGMKAVVSYTTRPPRNGEVDGIAYHFITKEEFLEKEKQGFFAETTFYKVANGETWYYGSAVEDLTDDKVAIVNPDGLRQIKKIKSVNPIVFYIMADEETIWNRLRQRGDDATESKRRLNADNMDFADINKDINFALRNDFGLKPELLADMILYTYNHVNSSINNKGYNNYEN